jgi:hypothetical protein
VFGRGRVENKFLNDDVFRDMTPCCLAIFINDVQQEFAASIFRVDHPLFNRLTVKALRSQWILFN